MARSRSRDIRRAMLAALKAAAPLTTLVPGAQIHPQTVPANPAWPFICMGAPSAVTRIKGACIDGAESIVAIHGFSKGRYSGKRLIETAEDHAGRIGDAIAASLDSRRLALEGGGEVKIDWTGDQLLQDPEEAGAFHVVSNFRMRHLS